MITLSLSSRVIPTADAQEALQAEVLAKEITSEGKLIACSLEFTVAFQDHVYKQGALAGVTGSINLWSAKKASLYASLKMVGADFIGSTPQRFKIDTATLFDQKGKPYKPTVTQCDDSRAYCAALPADAFVGVVSDVAIKGNVRLAFNRQRGGMDVPVVLNVEPDVALKLVECAKTLSEDALPASQD